MEAWIAERVRHDPWKLLVATTLLNVTSGRAARPVFIEILRRYPTPHALAAGKSIFRYHCLIRLGVSSLMIYQADFDELVELLYPIGLFFQRANSLKLLSQQYIDWNWPIIPHLPLRQPSSVTASNSRTKLKRRQRKEELKEAIPHNPYEDPLPLLPLFVPPELRANLDVYPFRGAGRYASDSFRIYSHLLPGKGLQRVNKDG